MVIDAAAWGRRLWEPGLGCEQQRVGWDGIRGSDGGGGAQGPGLGCEQQRVGWGGSRGSDGGGGGTKGCSRGGMIFDNHRGTGLMGAASAIHAVVVVAVSAALLRSPTGKK